MTKKDRGKKTIPRKENFENSESKSADIPVSYLVPNSSSESFLLTAFIKPNGRSNRCFEDFGDFYIETTAVPSRGKANKELLAILKSKLPSGSNIELVKGHTASTKVFSISASLSAKEILNYLLK